jgi:hypothetical protein
MPLVNRTMLAFLQSCLPGHLAAFCAGGIARRRCYQCGGAAHRHPLYSAGARRQGAGADCLDGRIGHYFAGLAHQSHWLSLGPLSAVN